MPFQQHEKFNQTFYRNCFVPALVCAAALLPSAVVEAWTPPLIQMIKWCLLSVTEDVCLGWPGVGDRQLNSQINRLLDGSFQRQWRLSGEKVESFNLPTFFGESTYLVELHRVLMNCPASSASVERSFASHARSHTWIRNRSSADSVETQLGHHSFLNHAANVGKENRLSAMAKSTVIESVLYWCWSSWVVFCDKLSSLDFGMSVLVESGTMKSCRAKLTKKISDSVWQVKWIGMKPSSHETFNAIEDPWVTAAE
jgi:hypothetical protein